MRIVALSGGVGGAKLVSGLANVLPPERLTVIANTADDFDHLGLRICPDLDTVIYNLAGCQHPAQGWGHAGESFHALEQIRRLEPADSWFLLGDKDLATHLLRRKWLDAGNSLTDVTAQLARAFDLSVTLLPMCDQYVSTRMILKQPWQGQTTLAFQDYFVRYQCHPEIKDYAFSGIEHSTLSDAVNLALQTMDALVICPSNPFVSIAPILSVTGFKDAVLERQCPCIVVSPIIAGRAVKGPAAKMLHELGLRQSAVAIAEFYRDIASHFVLDSSDEDLALCIA
ncbi:MAG: 2-phospho-L-lactate transferase [Pseudomonadota bacterium]